jgi:hypothetical protein
VAFFQGGVSYEGLMDTPLPRLVEMSREAEKISRRYSVKTKAG